LNFKFIIVIGFTNHIAIVSQKQQKKKKLKDLCYEIRHAS